MKKLLVAIAAVMISAVSYGQGQVQFNNLVVSAPITLPDGTGPGAAGSAQLYLVTAPGVASPVGPVVGFLTASSEAMKYINPVNVTVDGIDFGQEATFQVRAWTDAPSWEAALTRNGVTLPFQEITVTLGGGLSGPPPNLDGLQPIQLEVIPEPSTIALGLLGAGALLLRRRRK